MASLEAPPVLSTPDTHIFNETIPATIATSGHLPDEELAVKYEIQRTLSEIRDRRWKRIALQFPDEMLSDAPRVFQLLSRGSESINRSHGLPKDGSQSLQDDMFNLSVEQSQEPTNFYILADTSYGSCCVDEVAAEHINADAVVHYGRACLSPTARLPVLHIFTQSSLDIDHVVGSFSKTFSELDAKVILTADITYASHIAQITSKLVGNGYSNLYSAEIVHNPSSPIPNRTVPEDVKEDADRLQDWHIYHVAQPPTSLLLTLASRVASFHIFRTDVPSSSAVATQSTSTPAMLRRRYALVTNLATVGIWGILINTLSVKNYLHIVEHVKELIAAADKKSYMFVVGKLNAAKVANFSEIGGWVVIGCWESSLIDSHDFYKPVITPYELKLAMSSDSDRIWTGQWRSDFQAVLNDVVDADGEAEGEQAADETEAVDSVGKGGDTDSEEESAPPEFDLRTGKYVSQSRPMRAPVSRPTKKDTAGSSISAVTRKPKGDLISINGTASPGAEFLRNRRTWQGLGSDFEIQYEDENAGSAIQEGRSGVARGYTVSGSDRR